MTCYLIGGPQDGATVEAAPAAFLIIASVGAPVVFHGAPEQAPTDGSVTIYHRGKLQDAEGSDYAVYTADTTTPVRRLLDTYVRAVAAERAKKP